MTVRLARAATVVASLVVSACGPSFTGGEMADDFASRPDGIIGGTVAQGDPAVVAFAVGNGTQFEQFCTGTLVAPKTVLTAAHCINSYGTQYPYYVTFGTYSSQPSQAVKVVRQVKHGSYSGGANDFGILQLERPVTNVAPFPMNSANLDSTMLGRSIRHVGYGITNPNGAGGGIKREVTYGLREVRRQTIESGAAGKQTCQGDSGGPGFMTLPGGTNEVLVGIVSYGDQACADFGVDGRVDAVMPWIQSTMVQWEQPTCATDGACLPGCTPVDQDCVCVADGTCNPQCSDLSKDPDCPRDCATNGICAVEACPVPDIDCVTPGGFCNVSTQCRSRLCIADPQTTTNYCSAPCGKNSDCETGLECGALQVCVKPQRPERSYLDSCSPSGDYCVGGNVCNGPSGGIARCVKPCVATSDCGGTGSCEGGADGQRYCRPAGVGFTPILLKAALGEQGPAAPGCASVGGLPLSWLSLALALVALRKRR